MSPGRIVMESALHSVSERGFNPKSGVFLHCIKRCFSHEVVVISWYCIDCIWAGRNGMGWDGMVWGLPALFVIIKNA